LELLPSPFPLPFGPGFEAFEAALGTSLVLVLLMLVDQAMVLVRLLLL